MTIDFIGTNSRVLMNAFQPENFMEKVFNICEASIKNGELPISAIVVDRVEGKIVSTSHTMEKGLNRRLSHAEYLVLEKLDQDNFPTHKRKDLVILTNLEPCIMCLGVIMVFGITQVYYSLESPIDGAVKLIDQYFEKDEYSIGYTIPKVNRGLFREKSIKLFEKYLEINKNNCDNNYYKWVEMLLSAI